MKCLWCGHKTGKEPVEHIIPDSLGCPSDLVFVDGEVCARCNNRFSRLDQMLIREFDMMRFLAEIPNKKGKSPTVAMRPNTKGRCTVHGPHLEINMENYPVKNSLGETIGAYTGDSRSFHMQMQQFGVLGQAKIRQEGLCNSKDACRALHKVAFSLFAKQQGIQKALNPRYDPIRNYVRSGQESRIVLIVVDRQNFSFQNTAYQSDSSKFDAEISAFRLAMVNFFVDLSPKQSWLPQMRNMLTKCLGDKWTWVPLK